MAKTVLITGISASGKSTLGARLENDLLKSGLNGVRLLDGEAIRSELKKRGHHFGYTVADRNKVVLEYAHIASKLNNEGINCILCCIAHVEKTRETMRAVIGDVMEVYLDCPVQNCAKRDYKEQYAKAFKGLLDDFVGVTTPYQKSDSIDLILYTGRDSVERCSEILLESTIAFLENSKLDGPR